jgi:hypothetical protein
MCAYARKHYTGATYEFPTKSTFAFAVPDRPLRCAAPTVASAATITADARIVR